MWIIAGPNGAGKTRLAGQFLINLAHRKLVKLNAEERTLALREKFPTALQNDLNLQAANKNCNSYKLIGQQVKITPL